MKKVVVLVLILILGSLAILGNINKKTNYEYFRIHIRANSNEEIDQSVKYKIKDKIVEFLIPILSECKNKVLAQEIISNYLISIQNIADTVLEENQFDYTSKAKIKNEYFPTRVYDNLVLESGNYDALIVELGSGTGDNWWCVVYPPLCFVSANTKFVYKSKILEIIEDWKAKQN